MYSTYTLIINSSVNAGTWQMEFLTLSGTQVPGRWNLSFYKKDPLCFEAFFMQMLQLLIFFATVIWRIMIRLQALIFISFKFDFLWKMCVCSPNTWLLHPNLLATSNPADGCQLLHWTGCSYLHCSTLYQSIFIHFEAWLLCVFLALRKNERVRCVIV